MTTIAILGAGALGGALAHSLAERDCFGEILLADAKRPIAEGKALDIRQAGAVAGFRTRFRVSDDFNQAAAFPIVVLADAADGAEFGGETGLGLLRSIEGRSTEAVYVCAGASQGLLLERAVSELGVARTRITGSAPLALSSAIAALVAVELGRSATQVSVTALGVPPQAIVVPWSLAAAAAAPIDTVMTPPTRRRIEARIPHLWPPGPYTLASAAAAICCAIVTCSRSTFPCFVALNGELRVKGRAAALPVTLCPTGIDQITIPELTTQERVQLENAVY